MAVAVEAGTAAAVAEDMEAAVDGAMVDSAEAVKPRRRDFLENRLIDKGQALLYFA